MVIIFGIYLLVDKLYLTDIGSGLSGNLNYSKIEKLAGDYGFDKNFGIKKDEINDTFKSIVEERNHVIKNTLKSIVKRRNKLAHGESSFSEASKNIIWEDIIKQKKQLIVYLYNLLKNIKEYIENKEYRTEENDLNNQEDLEFTIKPKTMIAKLVKLGLTNEQIASTLDVSVEQVEKMIKY